MSAGDGSDNQRRLRESRQMWDAEAASFDDEPDHGLRDARVRNAWTALLVTLVPPRSRTVLDIGCGTGSLSIVMAGLGFAVTGIDLSPVMISHARNKAASAGADIHFHVMDAAFPDFPARSFDAIVCRHVLWALPDPAEVLARWISLLHPGGRLVLIEGYWHTSAGLHADEILSALPAALTNIQVQNLSEQSQFWGSAVTDERYVISADLPA